MAKPVVLTFGDTRIEAPITALNRDKVYGWVDRLYFDAQERECSFVTLLDDGRTMVDTGGVALKSLDADGNEIDKSTLVARLAEGGEAPQHDSVFDGDNVLSTAKGLPDYLAMDVKNVYQLEIDAAQMAALQPLLDEHKVLYLPFSYRAGYSNDDAFLLGQGEHAFIVVGRINEFVWSSLEVVADLTDGGDEDSADELDFNMF